MKHAKPLLFLTFKSLVNGFKRALTSPRRLISIIFFVGYYFLIFIRPALGPTRATEMGPLVGKFDFPAPEVIDGVAFGFFGVMSLLLLFGVLSYQTSFKPADVDVLFSTPISPKLVLIFRMVRDYLITLLIPVLFIVMGLRPARMGWEAIFRNMPNPETSGLTLRAMTLGWILMAMVWVAISYAASMFVNRSDRRSEINKRILIGGIVTAVVGLFGYIYLQVPNIQSWGDALQLLQSPVLRSFFFTATFATNMTLSTLYGNYAVAILWGLSLVGLIVLAVKVAMTQVGWMYDQAAVKGFGSSRMKEMQRAGDITGVMAERARQGKLKIRGQTRLHKLRWQGAKALLWKELFLQPRSMLSFLIIFSLLGIAMNVMPALIPTKNVDMAAGGAFLLMQGVTVMMVTMSLSQVGFIEVLRKVDLQKPLPFSPAVTVFFEIAAKSLLAIFAALLGAIAATIANPELWRYALAGTILSPFFSLLLSSSVFLVTILFPDVDDPTQRQFRGLMMLLAFAVTGALPAGVFIGLMFVLTPPLAALTSALICFGISAVLAVISGNLYGSFNPSD
jgi:hypothetical protein